MKNEFFLGTIKPSHGYTDRFRRIVAQYAVQVGSYEKAAKTYEVAKSSVWSWVKAFNMAHDYNRKYKNNYKDSPFLVEGYDNQFRRAVAEHALKSSCEEAAKLHSVSAGSVRNWVLAWNANNIYLNR